MTTYKIIIKDNSIPEYLREDMKKIMLTMNNEHDAIIALEENTNSELYREIISYLENKAIELDTDPEILEILSIIKQ